MHFYDWLGGCHSTTDPRYRHIAEDRTIAYFLEQGYLPSATTILSVLRHAYLEKHKIKLALDHYKLTQNYQESVEYRDQSATAKGTRLHKLCETLFQTFVSDRTFYIPDGATADEIQILSPLLQWAKAEVLEVEFTERTFVYFAAEYAGTADLLVRTRSLGLLLIDFKFKAQTTAFPFQPSTEHAAQLSAYRNFFRSSYPNEQIAIANLLIDNLTKGAGRIASLKIFPYKKDYALFFAACHFLWKELNQPIPTSSRSNTLFFA
jgi:hypothetical protein